MADRQIKNYDELYSLFLAKFGDLTGFVTDFNVGSTMRALVQTIVFFVNFLQVQIQVAFDSFRVKTAKGVNLDNRVADWQMIRHSQSYAQGSVVFISNTPAVAAFTIPIYTVVSTQEDIFGNTIDYQLNSNVVFPSGSTQTTGIVTCIIPGLVGNVVSGKITNIKTPIAGINIVTNPEGIQNGDNQETDDQLKARVIDRVLGLQAGNQSAILNAAYSVPGVTYAKVKDNTPSLGEFTLYFTNFNGIVDSTLLTKVNDAIQLVTDFCIVSNLAIPVVINTTISLNIELDSIYLNGLNSGATASGLVIQSVKDNIFNFVQLNSENVLRVKDIIVLISEIPGIKDVSSVLLGGIAANQVVTDFQVIKLVDVNSITVTATIT